MDQEKQANQRPPTAADSADRRARTHAAAVMRRDDWGRAAGEAVPDWATVQALTFTANGLAG